MTATVFGATGLIGTTIIELLVNDKRFTQIKAVVRKKGIYNNSKIKEVEVDYEKLEEFAEQLDAEIYFSCLGTTIKNAGTQQAQLIVDRDYPIKIAELAKRNNTKKVITVSSIGADINSSNFYLRTKGEMEKGVINCMNDKAIFVRPSIIVGNRKENRTGEKIGIFIMKLFSPLLFGKLSKYKPIEATTIASSMIQATFSNTKQFLHYEEMIELNK